MDVKVIAFYHFFKPDDDLSALRSVLLRRMNELGIKGTILLAHEGINSTIAGPKDNIETFIPFLFQTLQVSSFPIKSSYCRTLPFKKTVVKIKKHIVAEPGHKPIDLFQYRCDYLSPEDFHQWVSQGKPMLILDTRNDYEFQAGHFKDSIHLGTKHFADFEKDLEKLPGQYKQGPIVTFCTGGIRCEKAGPVMIRNGFKNVYQLQGGILNYFEKIGRGYFEGDCFVFDERVCVDDQLNAIND